MAVMDLGITQATRYLEVTTPLGPDAFILTAFMGRESVSQLFTFRLEMMSPRDNVVAKDLLGKPVTIRVGQKGEERYFHGICNRFVAGGPSIRGYRSYHAEVVPKFWLLTCKTTSRIFQHISTPDILKEVFKGLDVKFDVRGTFEPRNFCVQYRETDFEFASRLMEEEGIFYFFNHRDGGHEMVVANTPMAWVECREKKIDFRANPLPGDRDFCISEWEPRFEFRPGKWTLWDHNFQLPHKHLEADKKTRLTGFDNAMLERFDFPGLGDYAVLDGVDKGGGERPAELQKIFQENKRLVELRAQEDEARHQEVDGASNCEYFFPGAKFSLALHTYRQEVGPEYALLQVEHQASDLSHLPDEGGVSYSNRFIAQPVTCPWRPPRSTPRPRILGPQTAVVVGPAGEEIFTDKYGRVKVQFHWDREGKRDADSSCWVRVAQTWAGKQWGSMIIPRIGMEVLVEFLDGDPDRPLITGCVYNAEMMPPYGLPANKTQSGIKTHSSPGGSPSNFNEIRFEDKKGQEHISVQAEKDLNELVKNNMSTTVQANQTLTVNGTHTSTIKKDTTITVTEGNFSHAVEKGSASYYVKQDVTETFDLNQTTIVQKQIQIQSATAGIFVTAAEVIVLHTGASKVTLLKDGTIKVEGKDITITGTASVKVSAPSVQISGGTEAKIGVGNQNTAYDKSKVATSGAAINSTAVGTHEITGALVKIN